MERIAVWVFAACGGLLRYELGPIFPAPWVGTAAINLMGALLAGAVYVFAKHQNWPNWLGDGWSIGFLGGLTTFSSWMLWISLLAKASPLAGLAIGLVITVGGMVCCGAGGWLALRILAISHAEEGLTVPDGNGHEHNAGQ